MNRITKIIFVAFGLFCGAFANVAQGQGSPLMSPDSLIDFRNNHFCGMHKHFENVMQGRLTGSAPSCTPGYIHRAAFILSNSAAIVPYFNSTFIVYYEDATITGQQTGFYDPIDGLARRTVLERVLGYVKSQFSIADNANIEIYLYRSLVPAIFPANPICHDFLAAAYPIAPGDSPTSGVYKNNMYRHITEGHDPDSDQYDGFMIVNFDRVATLPITYYTGTDLLNPNPCDLDLFMLLLHEMGHNLGFYSLIQKNASNQAVSTYPSIFSLFDWHFLHTGDIKTTAEMNKFVTGTLTAPQINPDVNAGTAPEPLKYGNIWLYKQGGSNIHSPSSGDNQSSVSLPTQFNQPMTNTSHLDNNQTSFTNRLQFSPGFAPAYIMNSGMAPADAARQFSPQELRIFAQLGYTINPTVSPNLTNHPPHNTKVQETAIYEHIDPPGVFGLIHNYFDACSSQHRDQETFFAEREGAVTPWVLNYLLPTRTTIIQLSQLGVADSDGDLVSIAPNSFYVIQGSCCGNAITHTTSSITVTAGEYYHGLIQVGFRLYDGKDVGDFTTLTVKVTPSTHTSYPANLVLNGDYEAGTEVKTGLTFNDFQNSPIPNSPQQFIREAQYCRGRIFADAHPFFSTSWIYAGSGVVTKNSAFAQTCRGGAWRSNPFGYILTSTPSSTTGGGYAIPDPTPTGGNRFDIGYEFYSTLVKPMEKCKVYKLKCQLNTNILAGATSGQETPMTIYFLPTANCDYYSSANPVFQTTWNVPANSSWQDIEHIFKFCPNSATALPAYYMVIYANEQHITIDNISLEEVVNPPPMTVVLSAPATTVGQSAWLPITATVNPPGCALHYQWSLPAGSTDPCLTSGTCPTITVSPAVNTTYTVTVTSGTLAGCVTTATASIMITVSNCQQPRPTITASPQGVRCGGLSTALTAINPIHATTTFTWSNNTTGASTTVSPTVNTIYTVTATANGCSSTATYRVAVFDSPHFTLTPNNDGICPVNPTIISVNTIDHLALNWGNSTGPILNGPSLTVNTQGTYTVTATMVTGGHQCTATQSITISNGMPPQNLTITQGTYDMCNGINLTASAAYLYAWNTGDYTQMITTNPYPEATYTVTATALNGCTATASTIIRVYNSPVWNGFIRVGDAFGCPTASAAIVDYQHLFNATTHTFTSSDPIIVAGSFTIDQNFATENTEWVMLPGAKLVVQPYRTLTLNAGTEFHAAPCGRLWQGIVVNSRGRLVTTGTQAPFGSWQNGVLTSLTVPNIDGSKANNVVLRDAYRAIEAQNMARVSLDYTAFSNNYNGLYFDGNAATGTRALIMEKMHNCLFYQDFDDLLNPYDPALPYNINAEAGIKVKNAAYINLNPTNSFDEMGTLFTGALQRGIALDNTTMRVGNLTFSELLTESQNNPLAHGVDPIGIDAVNNSRLAYTGTPSLRFQNNTFSHKDFCILNTAVHSQSSSVVLDGVTTIDFVIRSNLPTFLHAEGTNSAVTVKNCILHSIDEQAIWIDNTTNMSKLLIENNLIEMTQDIHFPTHILFPNARGAIMVAGTNVLPDPRDPIQPTLRIANNTISTGASPAGIRVVGFNGLHINNNTVVLQSFLATREGIGLTNTSQTTLSCNNIRGEGAYS
ncbi:MAG: hypothetical protein RI894_1532, partial [Bacteroidota bacterium]